MQRVHHRLVILGRHGGFCHGVGLGVVVIQRGLGQLGRVLIAGDQRPLLGGFAHPALLAQRFGQLIHAALVQLVGVFVARDFRQQLRAGLQILGVEGLQCLLVGGLAVLVKAVLIVAQPFKGGGRGFIAALGHVLFCLRVARLIQVRGAVGVAGQPFQRGDGLRVAAQADHGDRAVIDGAL